jgi:hypothetical protein
VVGAVVGGGWVVVGELGADVVLLISRTRFRCATSDRSSLSMASMASLSVGKTPWRNRSMRCRAL